jgi:hypothetical protein
MKSSQEQHQRGIDPFILLFLALGGFLVLPCVFAALMARRPPRKMAEQRLFWVCLAVIGVLSAGGFLLLAHPWIAAQEHLNRLVGEIIREAKTATWDASRLWMVLRPFWEASFPFVPLSACLSHLLAPRRAKERLLTADAQRARILAADRKRAQRRAGRRNLPDQVQQQIVLGLAIGTGLPAWVKKHFMLLPTDELSKHGVIIGNSGSGKSNTLLRMAVLAARILHWQVILIDGKGDEDAGSLFVAAMRRAGLKCVKRFPGEPYNGWVGTPKAILSRLLAVEEYSDTHYRAIAENLLRLALTAPGKPVKTSTELLARLNLTNEYLVGLYSGHAEEEAYLEYMAKKDPLGVYNRYAALLSTLDGQFDGAWSYDDVDAAYICLDGLALSGIVSGLARYFVEDFAHYVGQRKPKERRVLFIFDDLGSVDCNLTNMFERVRARGASVYVSGQSDHSIAFRGLLQNAERILASATTIILHASSHPHEILARAGTQTIVEESLQVSGEQETGRSSLHLAEVLNVHPNEVMQLPVGEAYVIAHGKAQRVRILPVAVVQQTLEEVSASFDQPTAPPPADQTIADIRSTGLTEEKTSSLSSSGIGPSIAEDEQDEDLLH